MTELKRNLSRTREILAAEFYQCLDKGNNLWHGVLRLVTTLSSSFLVLTIALVEKLFPFIDGKPNLSNFLIVSWILLFVSIIFGIIAELEEAIFQANQANKRARNIKIINKKIVQGLTEDIYKEDDDTDYIVYGSIIWGAISIDSFIFAVICMCLALLKKIISNNICIAICIFASISLIFINIYMIKKRKM